jgi:O-methyltransferase involved in polyketide biosynthesis
MAIKNLLKKHARDIKGTGGINMSGSTKQTLSGVAETLLITLYVRAMESQRPDALIKDENAVSLVKQLSYDFDQVRQVKMDEDDKLTLILRNRQFDRYVRDFLTRHPDSIVIHLGCGLDARFERVNNGTVEWYDLDLPDVIELRRQLIGDEGKRHHLLGSSAFDSAWLDEVLNPRQRPILCLAEGVLMYFKEEQVKSLVLMLRDHFPGAELVIDAFSPFLVRANNFRMFLTRVGIRYYWGLKCGQELESWGEGIRLLDEWGYFDEPEPRLDHIRWMQHIPLLSRVLRIYHYQIGDDPS